MYDAFHIDVAVEPRQIDFLNRVFEGYDYLCVVSTVDAANGVVRLRGFGRRGPVRRVLKGLPFPCRILAEEPPLDTES